MSIDTIPGLVWRLLGAYAFDAWPFAMLHVVVVVYLGRSILRMLRETRGLRSWAPTVTGGEGSAAVLSSFIRDSESLGQRGFVVPITDYSDRLDSEVENLVDEVVDRTNMLLLVGIAGTLFGVFEFAARSRALTGDRLTQIGPILAESMAKAFPVGFIGLMLMLIFQLALAAPVSRLHRAASEATRRALEHRGLVSRTLSDSIADSIRESMQPVSTLGVTISEHLQPVVTSLGERLEQSLSLVKLQFGEIDQSTQRFIQATGNLHQSTNALTNTSARLEVLLKATPKVLAKTEKIQDLHEAVLKEVAESFRRNLETATAVAESLTRVRESAEGLPAELIRQSAAAIRPAFEGLATDLATRTRQEMEQVHDAVRTAAEQWQTLAVSSEAMVSKPLESALAGIAAATERALAMTADLAHSLTEAGEGLTRLPERFAERTAVAIQPVFERVATESSATWRDLVKIVAVDIQRDYADFVASSRNEVALANADMHAASVEMRRLAEGAQASLTEPLKTAIETARSEVSKAMAEVDAFVRDRYPAIRQDMELFGTEMTYAVSTLRTLGDRLRSAPIARMEPAADDRQNIEKVLAEILATLQAQAASKEAEKAEPESLWGRFLEYLVARR